MLSNLFWGSQFCLLSPQNYTVNLLSRRWSIKFYFWSNSKCFCSKKFFVDQIKNVCGQLMVCRPVVGNHCLKKLKNRKNLFLLLFQIIFPITLILFPFWKISYCNQICPHYCTNLWLELLKPKLILWLGFSQ